jgi:hypothetical protein
MALAAGCGDSADGLDLGGGGDDLANIPPGDMATTGGGRDMATQGGPGDMAMVTGSGDMAGIPAGGNVTTTGGTVDRLYFAVHGDTRPPSIGDTASYPTTIINSIYNREKARNVEFALDLGDHMFSDTSTAAKAQMALYMTSTKILPKVTFMTEGNHDCASSDVICTSGSTQPNYQAYMSALAPISATPYYTFDIMTNAGLATFVIVADNSWDSTQSAWLTATLTKADTAAKYTIVARHHPIGDNTDLTTTLPEENTIIRSHKYTLFLTGHTHEYVRDTFDDPSGRTLRIGNGGAPLETMPGKYALVFYGYGIIEQGVDNRLYFTGYDEATDSPQVSWSVAPQ